MMPVRMSAEMMRQQRTRFRLDFQLMIKENNTARRKEGRVNSGPNQAIAMPQLSAPRERQNEAAGTETNQALPSWMTPQMRMRAHCSLLLGCTM